MKYHHPMTIHHRIPSSWGGNLRPNNAMNLKENYHRALHTIYQDDTPIQRIRRTLEADKSVMRPDIYLALSNTLKRFEWLIELEVYEPDCFNADKFFTRLKR